MRVKKYTFLFTLADGTTHSIPIEIPTGDDGGYYLPKITQVSDSEIEINFIPSEPGMPAVEPVTVELPAGQGSGGNAVLYTEQNLTDEQKAQARENIGAATVDEVLEQIPSVGGSNGIELIESFVLTEDTSSIIRDKLPDGTPYSFKTVFVAVTFKQIYEGKTHIHAYYDKEILSNAKSGYDFMRLDNTTKFLGWRDLKANGSYVVTMHLGVQDTDGVIRSIISNVTSNPTYHTYYTTTGSSIAYNVNSAKITKIEVTFGEAMLAGAKIDIFGVRA